MERTTGEAPARGQELYRFLDRTLFWLEAATIAVLLLITLARPTTSRAGLPTWGLVLLFAGYSLLAPCSNAGCSRCVPSRVGTLWTWKRKDGAWPFIRFMASEESQKMWALEEVLLPAQKSLPPRPPPGAGRRPALWRARGGRRRARGPTTERPTGAARRETVEMIREAPTKKGKVDAGLHR